MTGTNTNHGVPCCLFISLYAELNVEGFNTASLTKQAGPPPARRPSSITGLEAPLRAVTARLTLVLLGVGQVSLLGVLTQLLHAAERLLTGAPLALQRDALLDPLIRWHFPFKQTAYCYAVHMA